MRHDAPLGVEQHDKHDAGVIVLCIDQFLHAGDIVRQQSGYRRYRERLRQRLGLLGLAQQQEFTLPRGQIPDKQRHHYGMHGRHAEHQLAPHAAEEESSQAHALPISLVYLSIKARTGA